MCDQISCLFSTHVSVDPLAKCVISEGTQLYLEDVTEFVSYGTGSEDSTQYRTSTVCLLENDRFALPAFELIPTSNPLRVLWRLFRLTSNASGDCRKFKNLYDVVLATDKPLSRTLSLPARQSYWSRHPAWTLRANGDHALLFRQGKYVDVRDFTELLTRLLVIANIFETEELTSDVLRSDQFSTSHESDRRRHDLRKPTPRFPFENQVTISKNLGVLLSQEPPRQVPSEWKKLTKRRVFIMPIYLVMSVLAGGLVAGSFQSSPAISTAAFIGVPILITGTRFIWHVLRPHRVRRLLEHGTLVYGHITRLVPTGNYHNDQMEYKIKVQFKIHNKQQTAQCHQFFGYSHLGAADSFAKSDEEVAILYDEFSPNRIALPQFLVFGR